MSKEKANVAGVCFSNTKTKTDVVGGIYLTFSQYEAEKIAGTISKACSLARDGKEGSLPVVSIPRNWNEVSLTAYSTGSAVEVSLEAGAYVPARNGSSDRSQDLCVSMRFNFTLAPYVASRLAEAFQPGVCFGSFIFETDDVSLALKETEKGLLFQCIRLGQE